MLNLVLHFVCFFVLHFMLHVVAYLCFISCCIPFVFFRFKAFETYYSLAQYLFAPGAMLSRVHWRPSQPYKAEEAGKSENWKANSGKAGKLEVNTGKAGKLEDNLKKGRKFKVVSKMHDK